MGYKLQFLADKFGCTLIGDGDIEIEAVCTLQNGKPGAISFLSNPKYIPFLGATMAAAVVVKPEHSESASVSVLAHDNPYACYARIAAFISDGNQTRKAVGIHPTAILGNNVKLAEGVTVGPYSVISDDVRIGVNSVIEGHCNIQSHAMIGSDCRLHGNVVLYQGVRLGNRVEIHSGAVIGADGFGIAQDHGEWVKVPQLGSVVIGNDVDIGAGTAIDRGAIEDTVLEDGVKLDNHIQIGHNVVIGAHTAIAGCVGVAGSAVIGKRCTIAAMALILGHLELVDDVHITAQSMVTKSIHVPGVYSSGTPLQRNNEWKRNFTRFSRLDDMAKRLKRVEQRSG